MCRATVKLLPDLKSFAKMKVIAEKNNGKIFDQYGDKVILWEPIIPYIREYEELVFHRKGQK
jgi:hypothetical protein